MDTPHVIQTRSKHLSWLLDTHHQVIQTPASPRIGNRRSSISFAVHLPPDTIAELDQELADDHERFSRYGGNDPRDPLPRRSSVGTRASRRVSTPALIHPEEVTWDGPDDPTNPQNWSKLKKWTITMIVIVMTMEVYVLLVNPVAISDNVDR